MATTAGEEREGYVRGVDRCGQKQKITITLVYTYFTLQLVSKGCVYATNLTTHWHNLIRHRIGDGPRS